MTSPLHHSYIVKIKFKKFIVFESTYRILYNAMFRSRNRNEKSIMVGSNLFQGSCDWLDDRSYPRITGSSH